MYSAGAVALAFGGPGELSLDSALRLVGLWQTSTVWLAIAIAVLLALLTVAARGPRPAPRRRADRQISPVRGVQGFSPAR